MSAEYFGVYDNGTGRILRTGLAPTGQGGLQAINLGEAVITSNQPIIELADWVNGGWIEQRPVITGLPSTASIPINTNWDIPGVPDGTEIWVDGGFVGVVDTTGLTLSFPVAAEWVVDLRPPFPYHPATCVVTVT